MHKERKVPRCPLATRSNRKWHKHKESVLQNFIHSLTVITPHRGTGGRTLAGITGRTEAGRGFEVSQPWNATWPRKRAHERICVCVLCSCHIYTRVGVALCVCESSPRSSRDFPPRSVRTFKLNSFFGDECVRVCVLLMKYFLPGCQKFWLALN